MTEKYRLIEKKLPIFAKPRARRTRYYLADNFLRAWLAAIASPVKALNFRPADQLVHDADGRLRETEGLVFERLVGRLYQERSRKGLEGFALTRQIQGYWDRAGTEIDFIALNEQESIIRFGDCKRSASTLAANLTAFDGHVGRFLDQFPRYQTWKIEKVGLAPELPSEIRGKLEARGLLPQDLLDLTRGL